MMNGRIRELARRVVGKHRKDVDSISLFNEQVDQFADLLIQECVTTMLKESKWYWDKDEFESSNAIQNAARRVKENFGIE